MVPPDAPSPSLSHDPVAGRLKLQEGLQKVLQQAESTNALAASNRITHPHVIARPSNLFDPARDPDAPTDKFVRFMTAEQRSRADETKMKQRLKLEAKALCPPFTSLISTHLQSDVFALCVTRVDVFSLAFCR